MEDDEFLLKLKELCLRFDLEDGSFQDHEFCGAEIYEKYCEENNIESDYREILNKEYYAPQLNEDIKIEYVISEEPLGLGDVVCTGNAPNPIGIIKGIIDDSIFISDGKYTISANPNQIKKLKIKEVTES